MNPPRNEDTLMRDPDMTIEARLKVDPDFATALYHEQLERIAKLESQTAERALQSACMELDIRNIISVEVSEAIEPARDKTIKLCDRTMTIKMRDGRIFKVVTYYDDQYSVSISADRRTMKINASAIVYPGSRLATNDKERK
jgi:ketosteroid isomerase-like protein